MTIRMSTKMKNSILDLFPVIALSGLTGSKLTLVDGGASADTITYTSASSTNHFDKVGYRVGDYFTLGDCTTAANEKVYGPLTIVADKTLTFATGTVNTGEAGKATTRMYTVRGGAFRDLFRNSVIRLYSGTQPASADDVEEGTYLCEITLDDGTFTASSAANGLNFSSASSGAMAQYSGDTWEGTAIAAGNIGWGRIYDNAYSTGADSSAAKVRMDFSAGTSGQDATLSVTAVVVGSPVSIQSISIPA